MKTFVKSVALFVFLGALGIAIAGQGNTGRQYSASSPIVVSGNVISCPTCGTGAGGGIIGYSASSLTLTANTRFFPVVGGGTPSTTETDVDSPAPSAATIANFFASFSTALGAGNTAVFTIRKNAADTSITCTVTGASQTECQDNTHSISVASNDLLTVKVVTTGTLVVTPTLVMTAQFGTTGSNGTVNNCATAHSTAIYSATGTAVSCSGATGTTGQVWTSNGASSDPTWQPASGGGGAVVQVETHTASSSTELDFTACFSSTYKHYMVVTTSNILPGTNNVTFLLQFSTNGGSTYDGSASYNWVDFRFNNGGGSAATGSDTATSITVSGAGGVVNTASIGFAAKWEIFDPLNTANFKQMTGDISVMANGPLFERSIMSGMYRNTTAVNAFRISPSSGNFSGTVTCYGVTP